MSQPQTWNTCESFGLPYCPNKDDELFKQMDPPAPTPIPGVGGNITLIDNSAEVNEICAKCLFYFENYDGSPLRLIIEKIDKYKDRIPQDQSAINVALEEARRAKDKDVTVIKAAVRKLASATQKLAKEIFKEN